MYCNMYIALIGCTDLSNMTKIRISLKVKVRLLSWHSNGIEESSSVCYIFTPFKYRNISLYPDILGQCIDTFKFCIVPSLSHACSFQATLCDAAVCEIIISKCYQEI